MAGWPRAPFGARWSAFLPASRPWTMASCSMAMTGECLQLRCPGMPTPLPPPATARALRDPGAQTLPRLLGSKVCLRSQGEAPGEHRCECGSGGVPWVCRDPAECLALHLPRQCKPCVAGEPAEAQRGCLSSLRSHSPGSSVSTRLPLNRGGGGLTVRGGERRGWEGVERRKGR